MAHSGSNRKHTSALLSADERQTLENLEEVYAKADDQLKHSSAQVNKVRGQIINLGNPMLGKLSQPATNEFFERLQFRHSDRTMTIPQHSLQKARANRSFGPQGVVPAKYDQLRKHVSAARGVVQSMLA